MVVHNVLGVRWRWVLVLASAGMVAAAACSGPAAQQTGAGIPAEASRTAEAASAVEDRPGATFVTDGWRTDFSKHTVPYREIQEGGPPKDGIPPIDRPHFVDVTAAATFLEDSEPVVVVSRGGEARAYPLQILLWHEIVNDTVDGEAIVITYCPLCNTALAFRRTLDGRVLDFGTTGNLRRSDLVMYDRQSESWWQQIGGEGIVGEYAGKQLDSVPTSILAWEDFRAAFPRGQVLSRETGVSRPYGSSPYPGYDSDPQPFLFSGPLDTRLKATERVVTLLMNGAAAAYPFSALKREPVVNDAVGGRPVLVLFKAGTRSALDAESVAESRQVGAGVAFSREVGGRVLTFRAAGGGAEDAETGSRWDITGRAVSGPLAGQQLTLLAHGNHFWFAWAVFRTDTRVYRAP